MAGVDAKVALERGRPVVLVCPPAPERAAQLWELVSPVTPGTPGHGPGVGPRIVLVCADDAAAAEWLAVTPSPTAPRVHAVTGLARSVRRLKASTPPDIVTGAVADLGALVQQAVLKLEQVDCVVVAWPEALVRGEDAAALDALLGEARQARRVVLSWNPALLTDFLERHARRPLIVGSPPVDDTGAQLPPVGRARFCVVPASRRAVAARDALDTLHPAAPLVWEGGPIPAPPRPTVDAVVCTVLPTRDELAALARLAEPVVLTTAGQLPYLRSIATLAPLALPGAPDRARDGAATLRERVAQVLATRGVDAELALLDPLFERFDPAEVAGALLAMLREEGRGTRDEAQLPLPTEATRVKVFINVGKKDRAAAKDLVGALIREAGVAKGDIGRVEVRETFSVVDLAADAAERALRGLAGATIRGRRVLARLDRER